MSRVRISSPSIALRAGAVALTLAAALTSGCVSYPEMSAQTNVPRRADARDAPDRVGESETQARTRITRVPAPRADRSPAEIAADISPSSIEATVEDIIRLVDDTVIDATLPPQALPAFIDTVFGVLLQTPYSLGPGVADRRDIISVRGSREISKRAFFALVQSALRDYGVVVAVEDGGVRLLQSESLAREAPLFIRSRTTPETPRGSRPIMQFFELKSVDVNSVVAILEDAFPQKDRVKFTPRGDINTLVIAGNAADVAEAANIVAQIDQPRFASGQVARVQPVFWRAQDLAGALVQVLSAEGYQAIQATGVAQRAVTIVTLPFINQLLIFSNQTDAYARAIYWVNELDQPASLGDDVQTFMYVVQNRDADELAQLFTQLGAGAATNAQDAAPASPQVQSPGDPRARPQTGVSPGTSGAVAGGGRLTVDRAGNRILFQGTPSQFQRARDLMVELDTPPAQVLIEVTIAEVTLSDNTEFGVEWALRRAVQNGLAVFGTGGGLGLGGGGFNFDFSGSDLTVALNALAGANKLNILSTPRLVARSGSSAAIQVGTDIPVITSQRATDIVQQPGGGTDVLQTVDYRKTGVILNVEPIVYGDNRVDILISQEVSGATASVTPGIASPTITSRTINTQVSLREGSTAVLGGLMQDSYTHNVTGIPFLKDIPVLGNAFKTTTVNSDKTELLVFITPYVMRDDDEIERAARRYVDRFNEVARFARGASYTLNPFIYEGFGPGPAISHGGSLSEPPDAPARRRD